MTFCTIMDPRMEFIVIGFVYPMIYEDKSGQNISYIHTLLYELFDEYVTYFEKESKGICDSFRL